MRNDLDRYSQCTIVLISKTALSNIHLGRYKYTDTLIDNNTFAH